MERLKDGCLGKEAAREKFSSSEREIVRKSLKTSLERELKIRSIEKEMVERLMEPSWNDWKEDGIHFLMAVRKIL